MKKVSTRTAIIFLDENDILHINMKPDVRVDYEDALDNTLVLKNLSKNKKVLKLIDARNNFKLDKKAQKFIEQSDVKQTIARAVIKGSIFDNLLLNFFTTLSKPAIPTKFFQIILKRIVGYSVLKKNQNKKARFF